jgi:DNA mismatch repair protein MutS
MAMTPMMEQYLAIKEQHKDSILFFRLGDFYEMFFEDALVASKAMEITLTGKSCGLPERAPMCGVPYHAAEVYIAKLIEKGFKVAICEQTEDASAAKGLVRREVVRIITPGTLISQSMLRENDNNYLAALFIGEKGAGLAYCDISTGEITAVELSGRNADDRLRDELAKVGSREILIDSAVSELDNVRELLEDTGAFLTVLPSQNFDLKAGEIRICSQFHVHAVTGLGLEDRDYSKRALGALLAYLTDTQKQNLSHIRKLKIADTEGHMSLDKATIRNLELTETLYDKNNTGSLLGILDKTKTAMGSRRLKQWIREPLNRLDHIQERLDAVEVLLDEVLMRNDLRAAMHHVYDLERLSGRIAAGTANGRDLIALRDSLFHIPEIQSELISREDPLLSHLGSEIDSLIDIQEMISSAIVEDPPFTVREGGLFQKGYSPELDELKDSIRDGQKWIASLEEVERKRTGIKNLKVGYNKVFGYYIEITKSYYDAIPENYIRKQTLVNGERFITPELKEVESVVLNAEAKINQMEYQLFQELRDEIQKQIPRIQKTAYALSILDVLLSFAEVSNRYAYVKPLVDGSDRIVIEKGRHPVLEQSSNGIVFVPNDVYLDRDQATMLLITGPNMSGKSTYMRQTALIVLMAQIGCFVPAEEAKIGLVDRIYTRIGASDNLSQGQSTFYVEMSELAHILNTATEKSLVILDEIGRGTSTYDGLSIAWAAVEYLCQPHRRVRTLFATHYHELTVLEDRVTGVVNRNVDVREADGTIVFLHKIVDGSTSRSYGIHVAELAGVPAEVLEKATDKLKELELGAKSPAIGEVREQISMFERIEAPDPAKQNPLVKRLSELDLMELTPGKAIAILEELIDAAKK